MKLFFTLTIVFLSLLVHAQNYCGFDHFRASAKFSSPGETAVNEKILEALFEMRSRGGSEEFVIPVVVHIVHNNGPENISDEQVIQGIEHLNQAFANEGPYSSVNGVSIPISFCLASRTPEGEFSTGINRVQSAGLTDLLVPSEDLDLKETIHWDQEQYLNIWLVREITREDNNSGTVGYSTFPDSHGLPEDGVVCEATFFGANAQHSSVHIHECGHYLGLYHTFEGGCPNDDCLTTGDHVCDTPPDQHLNNTVCLDGTNSCLTDGDDESDNNPFRAIGLGGLGEQIDDQTNFMDYSGLVCFQHFTAGQSDRMAATVAGIRASLLESMGCEPPCESDIMIDVTVVSTDLLVGEDLEFVSNSTGQTSTSWTLDGVEINTNNEGTYTINTPGEYTFEVILSNDEPGCTQTLTYNVQVSCIAEASFTTESLNLATGETGTFTNTSVNADSYMWLVNGQPVDPSTDLNYAFDEPGTHTVQLQAFFLNCSSLSDAVQVEVGSCSSGRESNLWYFFNAGGNMFGLDFNDSPPTPISEGAPLTGHTKTTLCDPSGDLLFVTNGTSVLNANLELMLNGDNLTGSTSSHFGALFVGVPQSDHTYYLFYNGSDENDWQGGLSYSVIDLSLDNGLGGVTDEKNIHLADPLNESLTAIRHCNLNDFWLVTYNQVVDQYMSFPVTSEGIGEPVFSNIPNPGVMFSAALNASPRGNLIAHGELILGFDNATGELSLIKESTLPGLALGAAFSPSGKYLFWDWGDLSSTISQIDLSEDPDLWFDNAQDFELDQNLILFYPTTGPDGRIYLEDVLVSEIAVIDNTNLPFGQSTLELDVYEVGGLINSLGNYYSSYITGRVVYVEGNETPCAQAIATYWVDGFECITDNITWNVPEGISYTEPEPGVIEIQVPAGDSFDLQATVHTDCGNWNGTLTVHPLDANPPSLGEDHILCEDTDELLEAGTGFDSYLWQDDSESTTLAVQEPGTYWVQTTFGECLFTDTINLLTPPAPIELGPNFDLCDNEAVVLTVSETYLDPVWQDGTMNHNYTVFEGGTYSVSVTSPCPSSDVVTVDNCGHGINGVDEDELLNGIVIFPNPSREAATLNVWNNANDKAVLEIWDTRGRLIERRNIALNAGMTTIDMDASGLAAQCYTVRVIQSSRTRQVQWMIQ
ncbi:MAG: hypothetical protein KDC12_03170 [Flavobacteriales bacterium]|nr:hypothetical protein [Flavobacteriales bacterium]